MKKTALSFAIASSFVLTACGNSTKVDVNIAPAVPTGDTIALTGLQAGVAQQVISFNRANPSELVSVRTLTGLQRNDQLIGIDYRPADGRLYGLGKLGNVYTINAGNGAVSLATTLKADPTDNTAPFASISGDANLMSMDFNPMADRLRVIGNDGQNLRINVDTGATITDGTINGANNAKLTGAAYTNSFAGAGSTKLYVIDKEFDRLYLQDANSGTLSGGVSLGPDIEDGAGFDIDPANNIAYAALKVGGALALYRIDLSKAGTEGNTAASKIGSSFSSLLTDVRGIALKPSANAGVNISGLTANNQLIGFTLSNPNSVISTAITGLLSGERVVGIDYRVRPKADAVPSLADKAGLLYALTNLGNLYTINPSSGAASNRRALIANPTDTTDGNAAFTTLQGSSFAVDFNPVADRLRVVSNSGQNLRINVDDGQTITDLNLNGVEGASVSAAAYTNSFADGTVSNTALFNLNSNGNQLLQQTVPNAGTLSLIGALNITLGLDDGFDIAGGDNGLALAAVASTVGASTLYSVNLATGVATPAVKVAGTANAAASLIGTASTPALIDLAILQK